MLRHIAQLRHIPSQHGTLRSHQRRVFRPAGIRLTLAHHADRAQSLQRQRALRLTNVQQRYPRRIRTPQQTHAHATHRRAEHAAETLRLGDRRRPPVERCAHAKMTHTKQNATHHCAVPQRALPCHERERLRTHAHVTQRTLRARETTAMLQSERPGAKRKRLVPVREKRQRTTTASTIATRLMYFCVPTRKCAFFRCHSEL